MIGLGIEAKTTAFSLKLRRGMLEFVLATGTFPNIYRAHSISSRSKHGPRCARARRIAIMRGQVGVRSGRSALHAKPSMGTGPTSKGSEITKQPTCSMAGSRMSLDVHAGGRMVGDSKRGGEGASPLTNGERTLIESWAAGRMGVDRCFLP